MKYGTREKIIGAVILIALAIIIVPMFFGSHKKGGQAPQMTINQQPINVPDQNTQGAQSGQQGAEGNGANGNNLPTENSGSNGNSSTGADLNGNSSTGNNGSNNTSVSQYNQLLPGSKGPQPITQQPSSSGSSEGSSAQSANSNPSGNSYPSANTNQSSGPSGSTTQPTATPAPQPAPVVQHHASTPPVRHPAPTRTTPRTQHPAPQHSSGTHATTPAHTSTQPAHSGSAASQDPIMAAADQYGHSHSTSTAASTSAPAHAAASGQWSVQVGSFQDRDNAVRMTARLRALGFNAYQITRGTNKVVLVGPYSSSSAGESARQQLQQKANANGFVIRGTTE